MGTLNLSNINSTGNLNFSGSWVDAPSGTIIQYVQAAHTAMTQRFSTTSTSYTASNYVVTITPKTSSSKILICANLSSHASNDRYIYVRVYNVTAGRYLNQDENGVARNDGMYESALGGDSQWGMLPVEAVDFPNSTSAQTYKLYIRSSNSTGNAIAGWSSSAPNTYNMNYMSAMEFSV
tara:strand:+ start:58 stop:594 length:537 start_codon:yes stop_codon:yes gene_type:complete